VEKIAFSKLLELHNMRTVVKFKVSRNLKRR